MQECTQEVRNSTRWVGVGVGCFCSGVLHQAGGLQEDFHACTIPNFVLARPLSCDIGDLAHCSATGCGALRTAACRGGCESGSSESSLEHLLGGW